MVRSTGSTRRVDSTRQRRSERPRKTVPPAVQRTQSRRDEYPPVMARTSMAARPARETKPAPRARRRYDVALPVVPGAEVRLPSLPQVRAGWRVFSFTLVAALAAILYLAWNIPILRVDKAEVTGLQRLSERDVNAVLDVMDRPVFVLDPVDLKENLQAAFPELSSVEVQIEIPNKVLVTVEERTPVLAWRFGGRTELVDQNGLSFPVREDIASLNLPVVEASSLPLSPEDVKEPAELDLTAPAPTETPAVEPQDTLAPRQLLTPEMVSAVLAMVERAPQNTQVLYDSLHGLGWKDPKGGWDAYFGDASNMEMKLAVYKALIKRLKAEDMNPSMVSVEFVHAPYFRLER